MLKEVLMLEMVKFFIGGGIVWECIGVIGIVGDKMLGFFIWGLVLCWGILFCCWMIILGLGNMICLLFVGGGGIGWLGGVIWVILVWFGFGKFNVSGLDKVFNFCISNLIFVNFCFGLIRDLVCINFNDGF